MSAAFTPGPWHIFASAYAATHHHSVEINAEDGLTVAYARNFIEEYKPQGDANANLIAAAPDLYEALAAAVANSDANLAAGHPRLGEFKKLYDKAAAALAKARGEPA